MLRRSSCTAGRDAAWEEQQGLSTVKEMDDTWFLFGKKNAVFESKAKINTTPRMQKTVGRGVIRTASERGDVGLTL